FINISRGFFHQRHHLFTFSNMNNKWIICRTSLCLKYLFYCYIISCICPKPIHRFCWKGYNFTRLNESCCFFNCLIIYLIVKILLFRLLLVSSLLYFILVLSYLILYL